MAWFMFGRLSPPSLFDTLMPSVAVDDSPLDVEANSLNLRTERCTDAHDVHPPIDSQNPHSRFEPASRQLPTLDGSSPLSPSSSLHIGRGDMFMTRSSPHSTRRRKDDFPAGPGGGTGGIG
jgi:hypothetical protein